MYFQLSYEDTQGSPTIDKKAWDFFWQNKQKCSERVQLEIFFFEIFKVNKVGLIKPNT